MKKIFLTIMIITTALMAFTGCGRTDIIAAASRDEIVILLDISDISEPVYTAEIEYSLNGKTVGDMGCCNANGTPLIKYVRFVLTENELSENAVTDNFSFNVTMYADKDDHSESSVKTQKTADCIAFKASYGNIYRFTVSGSFEDGFTLSGTKR